PKEPFLAWARSVGDDRPTVEPEASELCCVYLVKEDERNPPDDIIRRHFSAIFEEQLEGWHLRESDWPQRRTWAMFQKWFAFQLVDMVFDLANGPIVHD